MRTPTETAVDDVSNRSVGGLRYDWAMLALCAWLIGGLYLDGWAHAHRSELETFFTPWHAVLYSGFAASAGLVFATLGVNLRRGFAWRKALPPGYMPSLAGAVIFLVGGLSDMVWHTIFGVEEDVDALLSPTHLALALGGALILSGPLRSAWLRKDDTAGRLSLLPGILSLAFILCILTFFTQFAHPFSEILATAPTADSSANERSATWNTFTMDPDGLQQTRVTYNVETAYRTPSWSADGEHILASVVREDDSELGFVREIQRVALDGGVTVLTSKEADYQFPVYSPDGTRIAFIADFEGKSGLHLMNNDGTGSRLLTDDEVRSHRVSWSPDGTKVGFMSERDGNAEIYAYDVNDGTMTRLTDSPDADLEPSWSPDGRRLAYSSRRNGNFDVFVMDLEDGGGTWLTSHEQTDALPIWSPDGRKIAFVSYRDGDFEIYAMNDDGTAQVNLTNSPLTNDFWPAWSNDGTRIAYTTVQERQPGSLDFFDQALGISSVLLQSVILMGVVMLAVRRWSLPMGAFTIIFAINGVAMASQEDTYQLVFGAIVAGLVADLLIWRLRPSTERVWAFRSFAIVSAAAFYALYFATLAVTDGLGWPVELWMGSIVLSGVIGWLMSYLALPPALPHG